MSGVELLLALMFASGFETGDLSEWSDVVGDDRPPTVEIMEPIDGETYEETAMSAYGELPVSIAQSHGAVEDSPPEGPYRDSPRLARFDGGSARRSDFRDEGER